MHRNLIETVAAIAVTAVCAVLLWDRFSGRGAVAGPPTRPGLTLPHRPIPLRDSPRIGKSDAPQGMVVYSEFECPFCGRWSRETMPDLRKEFVDSGRLLVVFKHLPLTRIHASALGAAQAAECAATQSKFWEMHDLLFSEPPALTKSAFVAHASALGLNVGRFQACIDGRPSENIRRDTDEASELGITATPAFLLGRIAADGDLLVAVRLSGAKPIDVFRKAIEDLSR